MLCVRGIYLFRKYLLSIYPVAVTTYDKQTLRLPLGALSLKKSNIPILPCRWAAG